MVYVHNNLPPFGHPAASDTHSSMHVDVNTCQIQDGRHTHGMVWEFVTIIALSLMVAAHGYMWKVYSNRIKKLKVDKSMIKANSLEDPSVQKALARTKTAAQIDVDLTTNKYSLAAVCFAVVVLTILLTTYDIYSASIHGWIFLLILPLPAYMLISNLCNICSISVKGL